MLLRTRLLAAAALLFAPAALTAQTAAPAAPAADSLAFPRQFVKWSQTAQGDSAFAHAGTGLREAMGSADAVNQMAGRLQARFGEIKGTEAEVQFQAEGLTVYIAAVRYATAPDLVAWVVGYNPATRVVERASVGPLASIKTRFPDAKLP